MNNKFNNLYDQILFQQKVFIGANLITQQQLQGLPGLIKQGWDWLVGNPKEAEKAAETAKNATPQIQKIALEISDTDKNTVMNLIKSDPKYNQAYNSLKTSDQQNNFIASLAVYLKAKKDAEAKKKAEQKANEFIKPKANSNEGKMYDIIESTWGSEFAEDKWKIASKKKGVICVNKNGKPYFVALSKFNKYADKYLKAAERYVPKDDTIEDADPQDIKDYNEMLKSIVTKEPLNAYSEKVFDIKVKKAMRNNEVLTLVSKNEANAKSDTKESKDSNDKLINQVIATSLKAGIWATSKLYKAIKNINTVVKEKNKDGKLIQKIVPVEYELRAIPKKKFAENQDKLIESLEQIEKAIKVDAETNKKADKQKEFLEKCKVYQDNLPASKIANLCDTSDWGGNDFKLPEGTKMYNFKGKESATWNSNQEIDSEEQCAKLKDFLNTGGKTEIPAHPTAIANVLKKLIDSEYQAKEIQDEKQWKEMVSVCTEWIGKAEAIDKNYPEFKLK